MTRTLKKVGFYGGVLALVALALASGFVLWNFARQCRHYAEKTLSARTRLPTNDMASEAIVVLTGDRRRIPKALELLRSRGAPLLIISGANPGISLKELVNQQGGASVGIHETWSKILLESRSSSTLENAVETKAELRGKNIRRVILVTSEYHMYRAVQIFRDTLPEMIVISYPVQSDVSALFLNEPLSGRVVSGFGYFFVEYLKNLIYRLYRLPFSNLIHEPSRQKKNLPSENG